jgi:hypothetical protein
MYGLVTFGKPMSSPGTRATSSLASSKFEPMRTGRVYITEVEYGRATYRRQFPTLPALRRRVGMEGECWRPRKEFKNPLFPVQRLRPRSYARKEPNKFRR